MPVPQALVTRYLQLVITRQFAEAERELERIKQKMTKTEWNRGYFRALYGMHLSRKTNDGYSFFAKVDVTDTPTLHAYRREFLDHTRNGLHGDFDRGFFSAWADCMRVLTRMEVSATDNSKPAPSSEEADKAQLETLRSDKSQATIANFIKSNTQGKEEPEQKEE